MTGFLLKKLTPTIPYQLNSSILGNKVLNPLLSPSVLYLFTLSALGYFCLIMPQWDTVPASPLSPPPPFAPHHVNSDRKMLLT